MNAIQITQTKQQSSVKSHTRSEIERIKEKLLHRKHVLIIASNIVREQLNTIVQTERK